MILRKFEERDKEQVTNLIRNFFRESIGDYGLNLNEKTISKTLSNYSNGYIGIIAEIDDKIIGCIGGLVAASMFDEGQLVGQETMWFVDREFRNGKVGIKLIEEFEKECKNRGANLIVMVHMGNLNAEILDKVYKHRNYKLLERQYIKGV